MQIVHIAVHVKPEFIEAFKEATMENGRNSILEPGMARFDVVQHAADPARFIFVEAYRTAQAAIDHKETAHYKVWRDTVAPMMAEPRSRIECTEIFPPAADW